MLNAVVTMKTYVPRVTYMNALLLDDRD